MSDMHPMKITQVMLAKNFGGMERYFVDLCLELAYRGHQVQAICHKNFSHQSMLQGKQNLTLTPVSARGNWDIIAKRRIRHLIKNFKPEVIETHLSRATALTSGAAAALNIPLTSKTHNYLKLKYYSRVSHFIAATEDQRDYLLDNNIPTENISVIPNFSTMAPAAQPKAVNSNTIHYLAYGRFVTKKGFEILLRAVKQFADAGCQGSLTLGGDGPNKTALHTLCQQLAIEDRINFVGWITNTSDSLDSADVFILPSLDEPFGIVVLEAMARGIPVIATRTRGPAEILNENSAVLVPIGDPEALASAMKFAADNPDNMQLRAQTALDLYRNKYHADIVIPQIISLYRQLARSHA